MPIGTATCVPRCKFSFPRSYLREVAIVDEGWTTAKVDNVITMTVNVGYIITLITVIRENVHDWSSNCYTLDYVLSDMYYYTSLNPTLIAINYGIAWHRTSLHPSPFLLFNPFPTLYTWTYHDVPPAPASWWSS